MRLGDLDALYDCVEARYRLSSGEEHRAERALLDAICDSPTIDAIPVEWLKEHDGVNIINSDGEIYARRRITVVEALSMWQKEQEVKP